MYVIIKSKVTYLPPCGVMECHVINHNMVKHSYVDTPACTHAELLQISHVSDDQDMCICSYLVRSPFEHGLLDKNNLLFQFINVLL